MIHYSKNNKALCGWSGEYTISRFRRNVTCPRCLVQLGKIKPDNKLASLHNPLVTKVKQA